MTHAPRSLPAKRAVELGFGARVHVTRRRRRAGHSCRATTPTTRRTARGAAARACAASSGRGSSRRRTSTARDPRGPCRTRGTSAASIRSRAASPALPVRRGPMTSSRYSRSASTCERRVPSSIIRATSASSVGTTTARCGTDVGAHAARRAVVATCNDRAARRACDDSDLRIRFTDLRVSSKRSAPGARSARRARSTRSCSTDRRFPAPRCRARCRDRARCAGTEARA